MKGTNKEDCILEYAVFLIAYTVASDNTTIDLIVQTSRSHSKPFSPFSNRNQILTYIQSPCNIVIFNHFHDILAHKSSSSVYTKGMQCTSNPELPLEFPHNSDMDTLMFILDRF